MNKKGKIIGDRPCPGCIAKGKEEDNNHLILFDNGNNEIFPTDALDWFFDYPTGILTMSGNAGAFSQPSAHPIIVTCFIPLSSH